MVSAYSKFQSLLANSKVVQPFALERVGVDPNEYPVILPEEARRRGLGKDELVSYLNLEPVIVKAVGSEKVTAHFAFANLGGSSCSAPGGYKGPESQLHKFAKAWVREHIGELTFTKTCPSCKTVHETKFEGCTAENEYFIRPYHADVAVLMDGELDGVVEIVKTHEDEPPRVAHMEREVSYEKYLMVDAWVVLDISLSGERTLSHMIEAICPLCKEFDALVTESRSLSSQVHGAEHELEQVLQELKAKHEGDNTELYNEWVAIREAIIANTIASEKAKLRVRQLQLETNQARELEEARVKREAFLAEAKEREIATRQRLAAVRDTRDAKRRREQERMYQEEQERKRQKLEEHKAKEQRLLAEHAEFLARNNEKWGWGKHVTCHLCKVPFRMGIEFGAVCGYNVEYGLTKQAPFCTLCNGKLAAKQVDLKTILADVEPVRSVTTRL